MGGDITYPNGRVISYHYDSGLDDTISRLSSISDSSITLEAYEYLGLGTVVARSHPEPQVDLTYVKLSAESVGDAGDQYTGLDRFGRVVDQRWIDTGTDDDVDRFFYTYDRNSNRTSKLNALNSDFDEEYEYDLLDQLTSFERADGHTQNWDMDAQGNFSSVSTDGTPESRDHNAQNQLAEVGSNTLTFDANGNMTTDESGRQFVWDAWNRLARVKDSGGTPIISFAYDGQGWRISQDDGSETRDFYFSDGWRVIEERADSNAERQYVWSPVYVDAMIARDWDSDSNGSLETRHFALQDANYNVTATIEDDGTVAERYAFDPYGERAILDTTWDVIGSSTIDFVHGHQGLRIVSESGLHDNRMRWYSASLMRFASVDPIRFASGQTNLYSYVGNGPTGAVDPNGLQQKAAQPGPRPIYKPQSMFDLMTTSTGTIGVTSPTLPTSNFFQSLESVRLFSYSPPQSLFSNTDRLTTLGTYQPATNSFYFASNYQVGGTPTTPLFTLDTSGGTSRENCIFGTLSMGQPSTGIPLLDRYVTDVQAQAGFSDGKAFFNQRTETTMGTFFSGYDQTQKPTAGYANSVDLGPLGKLNLYGGYSGAGPQAGAFLDLTSWFSVGYMYGGAPQGGMGAGVNNVCPPSYFENLEMKTQGNQGLGIRIQLPFRPK